jgi:hypothetical protein
VRQALGWFSRSCEKLGVYGVIYYSWRDAPVYEGGQDFFGLHTGCSTSRAGRSPR